LQPVYRNDGTHQAANENEDSDRRVNNRLHGHNRFLWRRGEQQVCLFAAMWTMRRQPNRFDGKL
jgi:hypothetical protein